MSIEIDVQDQRAVTTVSRAIGKELRRTREALGWSRVFLAERLPSGICDRTVLSYEHGSRQVTVVRFIELCQAMRADMPTLARRALQRARIQIGNMPLQVDLRMLVKDESSTYRPMRQWALNTLNDYPDGVMEIEPTVIQNLARFVGCTYLDLARYLARFLPDE